MFSGKREWNITILIKFYIFWFYPQCPSTFCLSYLLFEYLTFKKLKKYLALSWRRPLSYRNWFLYDNGLRHERVKRISFTMRNFRVNQNNAWYEIELMDNSLRRVFHKNFSFKDFDSSEICYSSFQNLFGSKTTFNKWIRQF